MSQPAELGTAERIRDMAAGSFAERGFAATSMRDIARSVGVTPGAIYNHFDSKEALLYAISLESHRGLRDALIRAETKDARPASQRLDELVTAMVIHTLNHAIAIQASSREYSHLARPHLTRIVEIRRQILTMFESVLLEGVASEEFHLPGTSTAATRRIATSIVNMLISLPDSTPPDVHFAPEETLEIHRELVRRMVLGAVRSSRLAPPGTPLKKLRTGTTK